MAINKKYRPFIHSTDVVDGNLGIYLKEGYVFNSTDAACTFFELEDYTPAQLRREISDCFELELIQITPEAWQSGGHFGSDAIIDRDPLKKA